MQIHDLNTKALTNPAYVAFDDGTDTYKADFKAEIDNAAASAVADADLTDNTVAFTSGDAASPTEWTAVDVLTSGLPIKTLFSRISTIVKNVRWLYSKLGTTDISSIGGGTVTGAINSLNSKTSGNGTASNQYGSCTYSWVKKAGIVMIYFTYTPSQNISASSGPLSVSNVPLPELPYVLGATNDPEVSATVFGAVQLSSSGNLYFNGPRTANHTYRGTVTYVEQ